LTERSEHWLRVAVNERSTAFNARVSALFNWERLDEVEWLSPVASDEYAEYYDAEFLNRLGVAPQALRVPLSDFWPASGPRWDGFGRTASGKLILIEAKAYVEEGVDFRSKAKDPKSLEKINEALAAAKAYFGATADAPWQTPFYQYANRLAHLYFLRELNGLDAYLLFLYFADAPDVPRPSSVEQWEGAVRLTEKCLGLGAHPYRNSIGTLIWGVTEMLADANLRHDRGRANSS
jgi:hypothetical protein